MALVIPPAVNYQSPLTAVPSLMQDEPTEGRKQIPVEIDWGEPASVLAHKCVYINFQNNASLNISQVASFKIDNSECGADVQFIFPDTGEVITIPARTPFAVIPVFSNLTQFYVNAPRSLSSDKTRFSILNYATNPISLPQTEASEIANSGGDVVGGGATNIQLIPAGVNGTLETLKMTLAAGTALAAAQQFVCSAFDGTATLGFAPGVLVDQWNVPFASGYTGIEVVFDFNNLNWRFEDGFELQVQGLAAPTMICNSFASYRQP